MDAVYNVSLRESDSKRMNKSCKVAFSTDEIAIVEDNLVNNSALGEGNKVSILDDEMLKSE
jgi:hypothetical protein